MRKVVSERILHISCFLAIWISTAAKPADLHRRASSEGLPNNIVWLHRLLPKCVSADLRVGIQCNCDENWCKSFAIQQRERRREHTHVDACFSTSFVAKCKISACAQGSRACRFGLHAFQKLRFRHAWTKAETHYSVSFWGGLHKCIGTCFGRCFG